MLRIVNFSTPKRGHFDIIASHLLKCHVSFEWLPRTSQQTWLIIKIIFLTLGSRALWYKRYLQHRRARFAEKIWCEYSGVNFINIICALFHLKFLGTKTSNPKHSFVIFGAKILYKQCVHKTLMKLTPGRTRRGKCLQ